MRKQTRRRWSKAEKAKIMAEHQANPEATLKKYKLTQQAIGAWRRNGIKPAANTADMAKHSESEQASIEQFETLRDSLIDEMDRLEVEVEEKSARLDDLRALFD